jgi:hypothetical protein
MIVACYYVGKIIFLNFVVRLEGGWREAGGRLEGGWREAGGRL